VTTLLVTRPAGQAAELVALLAERGIDAISVPTVGIAGPSVGGPLDDAIRSLDGAAWLVITSVNGAASLLERMAALGRSLPAGVRVAAVGPATAAALESGGVRVDHVPSRYRTVAIAEGLGDVARRRVVLARADAATRDLIRAAFAHRRKSLARSLEHAEDGALGPARAALAELGLPEDARAEALSAEDFVALSAKLHPDA